MSINIVLFIVIVANKSPKQRKGDTKNLHFKNLLKCLDYLGTKYISLIRCLSKNVRNKIGEIQLYCVISWLHMVAETYCQCIIKWRLEIYYIKFACTYTCRLFILRWSNLKLKKIFMYHKIQSFIFIA